jgi:hypothetical protein
MGGLLGTTYLSLRDSPVAEEYSSTSRPHAAHGAVEIYNCEDDSSTIVPLWRILEITWSPDE